MAPPVDAGLACQPGQEGTNVGRFHRTALEGAEHRGTAVDAGGGPTIQPELQDGPGPGVQAHHAVVVALAMKTRIVRGWGQVFGQQRQCFADRRPARYSETISARFLMPVVALLEQALMRAFTSGAEGFGRQLAAFVGGNVVDGGGSHGCEP